MTGHNTLQKFIKQGIKAEFDSVTLYNPALKNTTDPGLITFLDSRMNEEMEKQSSGCFEYSERG